MNVTMGESILNNKVSSNGDLNTEPSRLVCIDTNLWLGNLAAATEPELLKEKEVQFILTVNSFPLPEEITHLSFIKTKYIKVFDTPKDDLLSHFEDTCQFIECGVKKGVVLVHCYHGVSRSPTIIIAYLMKNKNMTMESAFAHVKSRQESIGPNSGFIAQLRLFENMRCMLDKSHIQYKMFRLYIAVGHVENTGIVPDWCGDVISKDPLMVKTIGDSAVYKCKKCRRVVAHDSNIIPHGPMEKYNEFRWSERLGKSNTCQLTYFVEPLAWMTNVSASLEGKLHCPNEKCRNKLGSFSWVTDVQCSCGTYFCPGFYLIPSKVDKQSICQNQTSVL